MGFKPSNDKGTRQPQTDWKPRNPIHRSLESGATAVAVSMIIDLGDQLILPEEKKDDKTGNVYTTKTKKVQKVAVYVDVLNYEHDFGDGLGVQQPRIHVHNEFLNNVDGISFEAYHPRQKDNEKLYDFTRNKVIMSNSKLGKIAKAVKEDRILDESSEHRNDISLIVGKPFVMEVVLKEGKEKPAEKRYDENDTHYVYESVRNISSLMKGVATEPLKAEPVVLSFEDSVEDIIKGLSTARVGVKKAIMKAINYEGSNMQKALQQTGDEDKYIWTETNTWGVKVGEDRAKWEKYQDQVEKEKKGKESGNVDLVDKAKEKVTESKAEPVVDSPEGIDFDDDY